MPEQPKLLPHEQSLTFRKGMTAGIVEERQRVLALIDAGLPLDRLRTAIADAESADEFGDTFASRPPVEGGRGIESAAERLWQAESIRAAGRRRRIDWSDVSDDTRNRWRFMARAALSPSLPGEGSAPAEDSGPV